MLFPAWVLLTLSLSLLSLVEDKNGERTQFYTFDGIAYPKKLGNKVPNKVVNIPSFMVKVDSAKHIDFALSSPFGGGRPGRVKRKNQKAATKKAAGGDDEEEDDE